MRVTEMTAKSEMVYNRLLSMAGKGTTDSYGIRLLVVKRSAQVLVRLSVLKCATKPLRTNLKYVYKRLKLHVHKITRYTKKTDLYPILYQRLTKALLKGALLHCKRASFTPQKSIFYRAKGHLLPC